MFLTSKRYFCKNSLYYIKRRLSNTTCTPKGKKPNNISPKWPTPFLSTDKQQESQDENAFIGSLFMNQSWLTGKMEWLEDLPTVDAINSKMLDLYPQFTSQFIQLREGYEKTWEYLTMEDFRKLVDEINVDAQDPTKFPELTMDAIVR